ncbi:MAG: SRPBCC family protein [Alphaproteobacteria bacterium]|nr:SRPBCC family protein [Alphaproteobacteria bacterium]
MTKVSTSTKLPVSADTVWQMIGRFGAMAEWHPGAISSEEKEEGGATIRETTIPGGAKLVERLEQIDEQERACTYSIVSGPLPVANYTATISVRAEDANNCTVDWSSEFEPAGVGEDRAVAIVREIYETGFENLRKMYGG